ncbi:FkbM family methyltransferase [Roseovarius atlanticus]|uniref:FkbM family methyltransferase n=1 Tax=Roseovarius atlanticus TaxID=1641875 RepID=UPI001C988C7B|nr:FkbM family methyltransferase [Roseovarius atlanticus]MBY5986343.1 FkbM family methyltransferase [Roseovarius atlanticus]MBY6124983.1 FkbM family methyltransferase [Roseovarius atlanticus]MBY6150556.1 FkbM family methyltransferase [Roseovarius atlanticus]
MGEYAVNGVTLVVPDDMLNERVAGKLETGTYEAHEAQAAQMRLREGMRVLELGAGVGYIASICAGVAGAANVVTVEANPAMLPVIRANLDRNGYQATRLIHGAVTGEGDAEEIAFDPKKVFWAGRIADEEADAEKLVTVPMLPLSGLLQEHRPHLVIMDVEGAERHLFDAPWPAHVRAVMMELHPNQYPDRVIKQIVDCMSASGLTYDPGPSRGRILCFRRLRHT